MNFINPYVLWGTLAVAIPIIIHFWHQKRGTVIAWAATQWLIEKNQQQQRGLKFDNLLLLLIRSLLVILLAILLSQPLIDWFAKTGAVPPVHLVQPNALLVDNYRFELETALKKGEKVYWATAGNERAAALELPRQSGKSTVLSLQSAINNLPRNNALVHLYVVNSKDLAEVPYVFVPTNFRLHTVVDSTQTPRNFLTTNQTKAFITGAGRLTNSADLPRNVRFASSSVRGGTLTVLLRFRDDTERQMAGAALAALTDVYKLDISTDDQPSPGKQYDVVLTDQPPANPSPKTLYIVAGAGQVATAANVIPVGGSFGSQSDLVAGGQLPEWLGERLVAYFGLNPTNVPLSQPQLNALFVPRKQTGTNPADSGSAAVQGGLLLLFIGLIGAERWLALTKNA